ncbi:ABC transporter permease [Thermogemmata fonticola]|jgi:ABC-2 type transport system permease protein|uniref:ABC transporter permease n=1 Tax=Thermogemmata fonticola TaxID=2755323 RepID=A0A7V8VDX6_9BACT|nr:ABC transporter permease [Thermogemmata fonticola]MBA2226260.1 ABC transporter permease [Thermogemmata fonticola]
MRIGNWQILFALMVKDWLLFWSDRRAFLFSFLVPIILASAFGYIFERPASGSASGPRLPVCLVVEDSGPFTEALVRELLASPRLQAQPVDRAAAESALRHQRVPVAIVIPEGFAQTAARLGTLQEASKGGLLPQIVLLHDASRHAEVEWASGIVAEIVMKQLCAHHLSRWLPADWQSWSMPFQVVPVPVSRHPGRRFNTYTHSFCGMTLQYLLFWGMESGLLFLRERRSETWRRMRAMAAPLRTLLAAKALTTAGVGCLQVLATFTFGWLAFGVAIEGSLGGFVLLSLAVCLLAAAVGLLVAAWGNAEAHARNISIVVILGVSMLGGLWLPAFLLPEWVRELALALPTAWAMQGFSAVTWQGASFLAVLPCILAVLAFALLLLALAVGRLHVLEKRAG